MMPSLDQCPGLDVLGEFLRGRMSSAEAERIAEHLDRCRACESAVAGMESQLAGMTDRLRTAVVDGGYGQEPEYRRILEDLEALCGPRPPTGPPVDKAHGADPPRGED